MKKFMKSVGEFICEFPLEMTLVLAVLLWPLLICGMQNSTEPIQSEEPSYVDYLVEEANQNIDEFTHDMVEFYVEYAYYTQQETKNG